MARNKFLKMENRIDVLHQYSQLWASYFKYLTEDLAKVEITEDMEKEFESLGTVLAINHYKFTELCGEYLKKPESVMELVAAIPSLEQLRAAQEATVNKWQVEAHTTLIDMHKALGRMYSTLTPKQLEAMQAAQAQAQEA